MEYRLNTKGLEQPSVIKGVRHFKNRKDAMLYVAFKYGIKMQYVPEAPDLFRAHYVGSTYDRNTGMVTEAVTPAGEWQDDHEVIEILEKKWNDDNERLIEFVTYADAYTYEFIHEREYDYIETV